VRFASRSRVILYREAVPAAMAPRIVVTCLHLKVAGGLLKLYGMQYSAPEAPTAVSAHVPHHSAHKQAASCLRLLQGRVPDGFLPRKDAHQVSSKLSWSNFCMVQTGGGQGHNPASVLALAHADLGGF